MCVCVLQKEELDLDLRVTEDDDGEFTKSQLYVLYSKTLQDFTCLFIKFGC